MNGDRPSILIELERRRQEAIRRAFTRLHAPAFGAGVGAASGFGLFAATAILLVKGPSGGEVGKNLGLLGAWLPGFSVSWGGAVIGALYTALAGFLCGVVVASVRNAALRYVVWKADADQRRWRRRHLLDEI